MLENNAAPPIANDSDAEDISLGVLRDIAGYHLRRASAAFAADFSRAVEGTRIRQVLFGILAVVDANPGISQGPAGKMLGIQRANMVPLINELVDRDLIARRVSQTDRRAFELSITATGSAMLAECLAKIETHEASLMDDFTEQERQTLFDLLSRIDARAQ